MCGMSSYLLSAAGWRITCFHGGQPGPLGALRLSMPCGSSTPLRALVALGVTRLHMHPICHTLYFRHQFLLQLPSRMWPLFSKLGPLSLGRALLARAGVLGRVGYQILPAIASLCINSRRHIDVVGDGQPCQQTEQAWQGTPQSRVLERHSNV